MNKEQLLDYLIRNGAQDAEQRIDWANKETFDEREALLLLNMTFKYSVCARCGEPIYEGAGYPWWELTGSFAKQDRSFLVTIDLSDGNGSDQYIVCHACYKLLVAFPQARNTINT